MKTKRFVQLSGAFLIVAALALFALTGCQIFQGTPPPTPAQPQLGQPMPGQPQPGQPQPGQPMPGQPQPGQPQLGQPQPGQPQPGQPQPGQPQPGQPQPGQPQPGQPPSGSQAGEPQLSFTADRTSLNAGECATLQWNGQGGFGVVLNGQPVNRSGQQQVCPQQTTSYWVGVDMGSSMKRQEIVITVSPSGASQPVTGSSSSSSSATTSSTSSGTGCAGAPTVASFSANPTSINAGQSSTLSWGPVTNVQHVYIDQGLGEVAGNSTKSVSPAKTTTYTLTATGCGGTVTKQVTITVNGQSISIGTITPILIQKLNLDLAVDNIYPASTGHIMVTLKNAGNVNISGSYKLTCYGSYVDSGGSKNLPLTSQYANVNLSPGQKADYDTSFSRNPSISTMSVSCTIIPPAGDSNSSNDTMGLTKVK